MPRFRIKSLLIFTAIIAISIFLWMRYITPHVDSVGIEGSNLVIHMTSAYAENAFHLDPNDPYALPMPGPAPPGSNLRSPYSHDTYVSFYISFWTLGAIVVIFLLTIIGFWFFAKWFFRRRMQRTIASPNP